MKENGGPAFPYNFETKEFSHGQEGMSLRDYFAVHALNGYLLSWADSDVRLKSRAEIAREAYLYADAMLEARK